MNKTTHKLRTKFRPETHFALRAANEAPFRACLETEFERLKNRLLTETLLDIAQPELNAAIRRAANEAAALAWVSAHPLLLFPVLFEEKVRHVLSHAERQARIFANSPELVTAQ